MDSQISNTLVMGIITLFAVILGAIITLVVEKLRQKSEMQRLRLLWKREERIRNLQAARDLLDAMCPAIQQYISNRIDVALEEKLAVQTDDKYKNVMHLKDIQRDFMTMLSDWIVKIPGALAKAGDEKLYEIFITNIMAILKTDAWWQDEKSLMNALYKAYRRLEELATEV